MASDKNKNLETNIYQDAKKYIESYAREYAYLAEKTLKNQADKIIKKYYYDAYTPTEYIRTHNLQNHSVRPYHRYDKGKAYYGGVRISSQDMQPYYQKDEYGYRETDPYVVASLAWGVQDGRSAKTRVPGTGGWHGDPTGMGGRFAPIRTKPTPLDMLYATYKDKTFLSALEKNAYNKAAGQKYQTIHLKKR